MNVGNLQRNDTESALAYIEARIRAGEWTSEEAEMVFMLQDEPGPLMDALERLIEADPSIGEYLDRMD